MNSSNSERALGIDLPVGTVTCLLHVHSVVFCFSQKKMLNLVMPCGALLVYGPQLD